MKKLLLVLIAAGFASATVGALAADDKVPYTGQPKIDKPGRAADDTSGTTPPKSSSSTKKSSKKKKSTAPAPTTPPAPKQ